MLVKVESELKHRVLGSTVDDAAGECFDKTGKLMGLPYPAGPEIDRLAEQGNPTAYDFPRPLLNDPGDDFSFSGLKTSVRYFLRDHPGILDDRVMRLSTMPDSRVISSSALLMALSTSAGSFPPDATSSSSPRMMVSGVRS